MNGPDESCGGSTKSYPSFNKKDATFLLVEGSVETGLGTLNIFNLISTDDTQDLVTRENSITFRQGEKTIWSVELDNFTIDLLTTFQSRHVDNWKFAKIQLGNSSKGSWLAGLEALDKRTLSTEEFCRRAGGGYAVACRRCDFQLAEHCEQDGKNALFPCPDCSLSELFDSIFCHVGSGSVEVGQSSARPRCFVSLDHFVLPLPSVINDQNVLDGIVHCPKCSCQLGTLSTSFRNDNVINESPACSLYHCCAKLIALDEHLCQLDFLISTYGSKEALYAWLLRKVIKESSHADVQLTDFRGREKLKIFYGQDKLIAHAQVEPTARRSLTIEYVYQVGILHVALEGEEGDTFPRPNAVALPEEEFESLLAILNENAQHLPKPLRQLDRSFSCSFLRYSE